MRGVIVLCVLIVGCDLPATPGVGGGGSAEPVVVLTVDRGVGHILTPKDLRKVPRTRFPTATLEAAKVFSSPEQAAGRTLMEPAFAGEIVREARLTQPAAGAGVSALVPKGFRASMVSVPAATIGEVGPGQHVSVIATGSGPDGALKTTTLFMALVVGVAPDGAMVHVALVVRPAEAERLAQAASGRVMLAVHNPIEITDDEYGSDLIEAEAASDGLRAVVARRELHPGAQVRDEDLIDVALASGSVAGAKWLSREAILGRRACTRIFAGEPLREARLTDAQAGRCAHATIPRSQVLITIKPDSPPPSLRMGDSVDILLTVGDRTSTTLTGAVARSTPGSVSLYLSPAQAEQVSHASASPEVGVRLSLRNPRDVEAVGD